MGPSGRDRGELGCVVCRRVIARKALGREETPGCERSEGWTTQPTRVRPGNVCRTRARAKAYSVSAGFSVLKNSRSSSKRLRAAAGSGLSEGSTPLSISCTTSARAAFSTFIAAE